jgi:RNA-dependent RNA polymerase
VSLGGFDGSVSARQLADFLECKVGMVWRCRVKTSWTPPYSYPDFLHFAGRQQLPSAPPPPPPPCPHAFVHFGHPAAARCASVAAGKSKLFLAGKPLRVAAAPDGSRRQSFRFPDACVEIGVLPGLDTFLAAWRGPAHGLEFMVDPSDSCCRLVFARHTAFADYHGRLVAAMPCEVKLEFSVRDIAEARFLRSDCTLLLRLSAAPLVYYRTADDDIHESVPFDMLDDDDPWIRTGDITSSGAIGRCRVYRIKIAP